MSKELTNTNGGSLVDWSQDPFEQLANAMAQTGKPLKFSKGRWFSGFGNDEKSADGMELIADIKGLMVGWRCWKDKKIVDIRTGFVAESFKPPQRNELGDLDDTAWERDVNGQAKDPWSFGFYLRLTDPEDEEAYVYSATSNGARRAVYDLIAKFTKQRKKNPAHCSPVVELASSFYKHKDYGRIDTPELKIVDWRSTDTAPAIPAPDGSDDADLDDAIPF